MLADSPTELIKRWPISRASRWHPALFSASCGGTNRRRCLIGSTSYHAEARSDFTTTNSRHSVTATWFIVSKDTAMPWTNTKREFGALAKFFHWSSAAAFIIAYAVVYYVIWFMDDMAPEALPVLNIHWVLGIIVGFLVLPRLLWRFANVQPDPPHGSRVEHVLAHVAHGGLYALLIVMPLTGYIGTDAATDFGLFKVPSFRETAVFGWIESGLGIDWDRFEPPVDAIHHFVGKWIAWTVVALHVAAALFHHLVRRDNVLTRMLPGRSAA